MIDIVSFDSPEEMSKYMEEQRNKAKEATAALSEERRDMMGKPFYFFNHEYDLDVWGYYFTLEQYIANEKALITDEDDYPGDEYYTEMFERAKETGFYPSVYFSQATYMVEIGDMHITHPQTVPPMSALYDAARQMGYHDDLVKYLGVAHDPEADKSGDEDDESDDQDEEEAQEGEAKGLTGLVDYAALGDFGMRLELLKEPIVDFVRYIAGRLGSDDPLPESLVLKSHELGAVFIKLVGEYNMELTNVLLSLNESANDEE